MKCNYHKKVTFNGGKNKKSETANFYIGKRKLFDWYKLNWWQKMLALPFILLFCFILITLLIITSPIILIGLIFFKKVNKTKRVVDGEEIYKIEIKIFGKTLYWRETKIKTKCYEK